MTKITTLLAGTAIAAAVAALSGPVVPEALEAGFDELRRLGLTGTSLATAYCSTLRLKLLKIGARVRVTVRKVWVSLASSHPAESIFALAHERLRASQ